MIARTGSLSINTISSQLAHDSATPDSDDYLERNASVKDSRIAGGRCATRCDAILTPTDRRLLLTHGDF